MRPRTLNSLHTIYVSDNNYERDWEDYNSAHNSRICAGQVQNNSLRALIRRGYIRIDRCDFEENCSHPELTHEGKRLALQLFANTDPEKHR